MDVVCFHNPNEENGYLSNWYPSNFAYGRVMYTSMEQYMMHRKALLFDDYYTACDILCTDDVAKIKALGRKVKNFSSEIWDKYKFDIICEGVKEKFSQNEDLKIMLLSTGDSVLAECAVHDRVWGIGLSMKDPKRFDESQWRGENLLGKALMKVREYLGCIE